MADSADREGAIRVWSTRKSLSESTLPQDYLEKLEQKRKNLDDSIHKYIAAKEREYKHFQKELKQQYKLSQGQDGRNDSSARHSPMDRVQDDAQDSVLEAQRISPIDALLLTAEKLGSDETLIERNDDEKGFQNRSAMAGINDRRASVEREKDLLGLFTPEYLPALNAKDVPALQRSTSASHAVEITDETPRKSPFERANSDSLLRAKPHRPAHLALVQRTSSSGSSADGKLASALKSPSQRPKQKRVSLAVGDSIVAPSDSVPSALSYNTTSSHSRKRSSLPEREYPISVKRPSIENDSVEPMAESSFPGKDDPTGVNQVTEDRATRSNSPLVKISTSTSPPRPIPASSKIDPDGDLFDLEDEDETLPPPQIDSDDSDSVLENGNDISGRIDPFEHVGDHSDTEVGRYDSTTGLIPEPANEDEDCAVPYLAFGPSSAVAPIKPGFRRPSVIDDPVFKGAGYKAAQQDAVENEIYGSSFNRPSSKGSFKAGSVGESYMAKHAEDMMKLRRQQAQIKS